MSKYYLLATKKVNGIFEETDGSMKMTILGLPVWFGADWKQQTLSDHFDYFNIISTLPQVIFFDREPYLQTSNRDGKAKDWNEVPSNLFLLLLLVLSLWFSVGKLENLFRKRILKFKSSLRFCLDSVESPSCVQILDEL